MSKNFSGPPSIGLGAMVSAGVPLTLFLVTVAVCERISLLPVDIQIGSVVFIALLLLVASVRSLFRAFAVARESPGGLRNFFYGLLIHIGVSSVLCLAVFLVKV